MAHDPVSAYAGDMSKPATRVIGWGPFKLPGEDARLQRAADKAERILGLVEETGAPATAATDEVEGGANESDQLPPVSVATQPSMQPDGAPTVTGSSMPAIGASSAERDVRTTQERSPLLHRGVTVLDADGGEIGKVENVYLDDETGEPSWVTVGMGFGMGMSFVPLNAAIPEGGAIRVPHGKDKVKAAPRKMEAVLDAAFGNASLSPQEEQELYSYYGIGDALDTGTAETTGAHAIGDENTAATDAGGVVTPHEDEVVADEEIRHVERVSLGTETVTEHETVGEQFRKQRAETDVDNPNRR